LLVILQLVTANCELCICEQVVFESWAVMTRAVEKNGWGLEPAAAEAEIARILRSYTLIPDPPGLLDIWLTICTDYKVRGLAAHDARLAAFAISLGIRELVTFNAKHFSQFDGLVVLTPPL